MARRRSLGARLHAALIVGGLTVGILVLVFLQFALPYWIGPVGLFLVGFVDAAIYLEIRHRRTLRKRARTDHRALGMPQGLYPAAPARRHFEDATAAIVALLLFIVGFYVQGLGIRVIDPAYPPAMTNWTLILVGKAVVTIAFLIVLLSGWRMYRWRSESELYDTTDDR